MADAVSKLYAEIGFKVREDDLKKVKAILQDFKTQMEGLNKATQNAARQFGIFSKDQAKQEIHNAKLATEASRKAVQDKRIQLMEIRELDRQNDRAKREKEKEEKRIKKEQAQQEKQQQREAEKASREQRKRLKESLNSFRSFGVGLRNTFMYLAGIAGATVTAGVNQSLNRSIQTRDFMLQTGVGLKQLQNIIGGFANIGSGMGQQQIMSDIVGVSQNLQEIALGKGDLAPYKLLGLAAKRGDVMGVISEAGRAIQGLDNPMALNLLKKIGLSSDWLSYFRLQQKEGGSQAFIDSEGQEAIVNAKTSVRQLNIAFKNLSDRLTAEASPAIQKFSKALIESFDSLSGFLKGSGEKGASFFENLKKQIEIASGEETERIKDAIKFIGKWIVGLPYQILKYAGFAYGYTWGSGDVEDDAERRKKYGVNSDFFKRGQEIANKRLQDNLKNAANGTAGAGKTIYIDNKTLNSTINGVENEETADKLKEEMIKAGFIPNKDVKNNDLHMATNLNVMAGVL